MLQTFRPAGSRLTPSDRPRRRDRTGPYRTCSSGGSGMDARRAKLRPRHIDCLCPDESGPSAGISSILTPRGKEGQMRSRILVGAVLVFGLLAVGVVATSGDQTGPSKRWAIVNFVDAVRVNREFVMGPCLIVHDDTKMARGEPCTTIYRFDAKKGPQEVLVAFMCKPIRRGVIDVTKVTIVPLVSRDLPNLTEYQFAGDAEGHGVPVGR